MKDLIGDRVKAFESATDIRLDVSRPIVARIDGRAFHNFTLGMSRPFDPDLTDAMIDTTKHLVEETGARIGFTQSDEITLVWQCTGNQQMWFGGRLCKMVSMLASEATLFFFTRIVETMPTHAKKMPKFDARVWCVPSQADAVEALLWRQHDAVKNSISALAQSEFSHRDLQNKSGKEKLAMLAERGVDWDTIDPKFTRGTFVRAIKTILPFTVEEIETLPPKHSARLNPGLTVERTIIRTDSPQFLSEMADAKVFVFGETGV